MWTLEEALPIVRDLTTALREIRYAVALGGSVLYRGTSTKDLDLVVYPYCVPEKNETALKEALVNFGFVLKHNKEYVQEGWRRRGSQDIKHVEVWTYQNKRVDIIIVE